ncbi:MAG TPA: hypothetical protein VMM12_06280 [Longimicrobiales bacterium]|nr:hypothetical protein [Longimicrobiales bacterium]
MTAPGRGRVVRALVLALAATDPAAAVAGQAPVEPGGIATVVARVAAPAGADSVRFRVETAPGVRAFGRAAGEAAIEPGRDLRLPFTFGVPADAAAGRFLLARAHLEWAGGGRDSLELAVEVAARRGATFRVGAEAVTASAGATCEIGYRLRNGGNGPDTFRVTVEAPAGWTVRAMPDRVVMAAGDTAAGLIRLAPPASAPSGEEAVVSVSVTGTGVRESRTLRALVVGEAGWLGGLAHVPGTLFIGSSSDAGGLPGVALEAAGEIRPGARLSLALRQSDEFNVVPAFRGVLGGPRIRLGVHTSAWDVRLGDIFGPSEILTGPVSQGRGVEVQVRGERSRGQLFVATPLGYGLAGEAGHVLRGAASVTTPVGQVGIKASSVHRESALFGAHGRAGVTATWAYRGGPHDVAAEAGMLEVSGDSADQAGFAAQAVYFLRLGRGSLTARLRKVPATTRAAPSQGDEAFFSGSFGVAPTTTLVGWAFASSSPYTDATPYGASRGGAGGVRVRLPLDAEAELLGTHRATDVVGDTLPGAVTRAVRASLDVPVGPVRLETDAELGTTASDLARPYRQLRAGARWTAHGQWAWVGVSHHDLGLAAPQTGLDLAGAVVAREVEVQGGLNVRLTGAAGPAAVAFWSGATIPVRRDVRLALGVDHRPAVPGPAWRLSLGVSRAFGLPLPLPRQPVLFGVVFEDLDGDLVRGDGERRVEGVTLLLGPLRARTDGAGEFRFHDRAGGDLRLEPRGMPEGFVIPAEVHLPAAGYVEIPVIRTAALELELFLDRDGDGEMDGAEAFADGAVVSLRDAAGRTRDAATDERGRVRFGSLPPGLYTLLVYTPGIAGRPSQPLEIPLTIEPGTTLERRIAVPPRRREIRMPAGGG